MKQHGAAAASIGWVAGLLDGEGSFGIYKDGAGAYRAQLRVQMTSLATVTRLRSILGVGTIARQDGRPGRKASFTWNCGRASELIHVLAVVIPHLAGSLAEARLLLDFLRGHGDPESQYRTAHNLKTRLKPSTADVCSTPGRAGR